VAFLDPVLASVDLLELFPIFSSGVDDRYRVGVEVEVEVEGRVCPTGSGRRRVDEGRRGREAGRTGCGTVGTAAGAQAYWSKNRAYLGTSGKLKLHWGLVGMRLVNS